VPRGAPFSEDVRFSIVAAPVAVQVAADQAFILARSMMALAARAGPCILPGRSLEEPQAPAAVQVSALRALVLEHALVLAPPVPEEVRRAEV
jgi:hypothetical protein